MQLCSIEGCNSAVHAKGKCGTHYNYERRTGKKWRPGLGQVWPMEDRFWPKVDKGDPDECWEWQGCILSTGYGSVGKGGLGNGSIAAHRASYELHYGEIPKGMVVMHTCDNRACVNPAHLRLGTHKENTHDMMAKGRHRFKAPLGEKSSLSKITEQAARFIKKHSEIPAAEIAEAFGIKYVAVWRIRTGRTWPHI